MKKVILSVLIISVSTFAAHAQKGSILVYGNVGLTTSNSGISGEAKKTITNFNPALGYQFNDNWTAGLSFNYANTNASYTDQQLSISPFIRYAKSISPIFSIYGQLQAGYLHQSENPGDYKANGFTAEFFPAIFINIKNSFGLNFSFGGITYNKVKPSGGSTASSFGLTFGQGASFGISKNFGGHHKS
ncbi:MAG: outer membrane beta-barrel protein [Bacteroidetes bacterium]|nr:outer membrane beta-barrel protein [Bacteroidota bacterium]